MINKSRKQFYATFIPSFFSIAIGVASFAPVAKLESHIINNLKTSKSTPNIIFIMADDLGWNSMGYEDYDLDFATPHLTRFAKEGIRMDNYYSQEVSP